MNILFIFTKYDLTSEFMMYMFAVVMLILTYISRPARTKTLIVTKIGLVCSILTITTHVHLLWMTCIPETFSRSRFLMFYFMYAIMYTVMLSMIMLYIDLLSYKKRQHLHAIHTKLVVLAIVYYVIVSYPAFTDKLYAIQADGSIVLTKWQNVIPLCGIIDSVFCLISSIRNIKSVSKVVSVGTLTFIPMTILALFVQYRFDTAYFISFTYVMPFAIFYCLFHAVKYNDIVGCQSFEALPATISRAIKFKRNFVLINVGFPQLKSREFSNLTTVIEDASSSICRQIERLNSTGRIYITSDYSFTLFARVKNPDEAAHISQKIKEILDVPVEIHGVPRRAVYKQISIYSKPMITDPAKYISMIGFLQSKLTDASESESYAAVESDYTKFMSYDEAEKLVLDVRAAANLDDDRVICYIQPIHNIETGTFRSGEALMRMQDNGKILYPDSFIPAAERTNCIHTLTLIMINRICKKIKELEQSGYDFDGITVNCSTLEIADPDFSQEIKDIVRRHNIIPSHLRLEITETMTVLDMSNVQKNMQELIEYGISFYLDDYGTGYSNLERMATYPFDTIKFDKSILYSALKNPKTDDLLRLQLEYFKDNGFHTVIEGVEDETQYDYCKEIGFEMIQGYYFSKPQPAESITEYFLR